MTSISDSSTRTIQLVAGSATTSFDGLNTFRLQLPASGFRTGKDEIALKSMSLHYSWPNVSSRLGNNRFSYIWGSRASGSKLRIQGTFVKGCKRPATHQRPSAIGGI